MNTLYCAECEKRFEPDDDHIWLSAEHRRINDRNDQEEFAFCPDCWMELTDEWMDPV